MQNIFNSYLFVGSHEAAQQAAMIYSFLGTCKINNIEPYSWLKETLSRIPIIQSRSWTICYPTNNLHNNLYRKYKRHQTERLRYNNPYNINDTLKITVQITDKDDNKSNIARMEKIYSY